MSTLITQHPICLDDQKYLIPDNAEIGDNVGKVNYLWSHPYFYNRKFGSSLNSSNYSFSIISGNGDGTFAIDGATGELTIADNSSLASDKSIVVRVQVFPWYYKDTTCTILVIPEADCLFFDSSYDGSNGASDGTRLKPFLKLNNVGSSTGTAGVTYLYKRGQTYTADYIQWVNPKVGVDYPEYINFGAYGQGARPYRDGTGETTRFMSVGVIPFGNDPIDPADVCNNLRVFDIEAGQDTMTDWYPFLIRPAGDNIEFHRIKCSRTTFSDGLIYLPTSDLAGEPDRNIYFADIELFQTQDRGFKIETSGVTVRNNYGENDGTLTLTEVPCAQAAHRPMVDIKYVVCKVANVSTNNLGLQIRAGKHTYEWCYIEGFAFATVVYIHQANDGLGGDYNITSTSWYKNIIIENALTAGYFGRQPATSDVSNGVIFENIDLINCVNGMQVAEGATNTKLSGINASDCSNGSNITIFSGASSAGAGTIIENCTALNTGGGDRGLRLDGPSILVYNTLYSGVQGTISGSNNTTSTAEIDLLGQGIDRGRTFDYLGNPIPSSNPSIGAKELAELQYTVAIETVNGIVSGGGVVDIGNNVTLTATNVGDYVFVGWYEDGTQITTGNPYTFTPTSDSVIVGEFEIPSAETVVIYLKGIRFVSV